MRRGNDVHPYDPVTVGFEHTHERLAEVSGAAGDDDPHSPTDTRLSRKAASVPR